MRVPDEMRQCIVFIGFQDVTTTGHSVPLFKGTAFFVGIPSEKKAGSGFLYLVTAGHVARRLSGRELIIRANTKDGRSHITKSGSPVGWWYHPVDASVDVAVLDMGIPDEIYEYRALPVGMFLSEQIIHEKKIGTGDEAFITGLFILKFYQWSSEKQSDSAMLVGCLSLTIHLFA